MGIMICSKHGRSGFIETCSHIGRIIDAGEIPIGRRLDILGALLVCEDCFSSLGFDKCEGLADISGPSFDADDPRWPSYEAAYDAMEGRRAFCSKCFAELERKQKSL